MNRLLRSFLCIVSLFALVGCASTMSINTQTRSLDLKDKALILASIELSRIDSSLRVPHPASIRVTSRNPDGSAENQAFNFDQTGFDYANTSRDISFVRIAVPAGRHSLASLIGTVNLFPLRGIWLIPLELEFDAAPGTVSYLGRLKARLRPRNDGEQRAGSLLPLIDQAATGVSTGTFDWEFIDNAPEDLASLRNLFPVLSTHPIHSGVIRTAPRVGMVPTMPPTASSTSSDLPVASASAAGSAAAPDPKPAP